MASHGNPRTSWYNPPFLDLVKFRLWCRRLVFDLATVLGIARLGVFIPYRYANLLPPPDDVGRAYPALIPWFAASAKDMCIILSELWDWEKEFQILLGYISSQKNDPVIQEQFAPRWNQDWFPCLDAALAYHLVRREKPTHIVEIGSGHSTRFLWRAIQDGGLETVLTAIDPAPRATLETSGFRRIQEPLQNVDPALILNLQAGDMLCIDSSHLLLPGSDVDRLLGHYLPRLPAGLLLHIHDIFLPDDYPAHWAGRGYTEQQAVAAMLAGGGFDLVFSSHYARFWLADALADSLVQHLPLIPGAVESSLWLRKRTAPLV